MSDTDFYKYCISYQFNKEGDTERFGETNDQQAACFMMMRCQKENRLRLLYLHIDHEYIYTLRKKEGVWFLEADNPNEDYLKEAIYMTSALNMFCRLLD